MHISQYVSQQVEGFLVANNNLVYSGGTFKVNLVVIYAMASSFKRYPSL